MIEDRSLQLTELIKKEKIKFSRSIKIAGSLLFSGIVGLSETDFYRSMLVIAGVTSFSLILFLFLHNKAKQFLESLYRSTKGPKCSVRVTQPSRILNSEIIHISPLSQCSKIPISWKVRIDPCTVPFVPELLNPSRPLSVLIDRESGLPRILESVTGLHVLRNAKILNNRGMPHY